MTQTLMTGSSYFSHIKTMTALFGLPTGCDSLTPESLYSDLQEEVLNEQNPTRSVQLGYLLGLKWHIWNVIHTLERMPELQFLDELANAVDPDPIADAVAEHTASIFREYYAAIHAIEKTFYLNRAVDDMKRIGQLARCMAVRKGSSDSGAGSDDLPLPMHMRFNVPDAQTAVDVGVISKKIAITATRMSWGVLQHTNLIPAIARGASPSLIESFRHHLGDKQGPSSAMANMARMLPGVSRFNNLIGRQHDVFVTEVRLAAKKLNLISGKSAERRVFLMDKSIPLPHAGTIVAWLGLCSLGVWEDSLGAQYSVFILPHMPTTYEHKNHGGIVDVSSDIEHSLPSRSSAHIKDKYGQIDHGVRLAMGVRISPGGLIHTEHLVLSTGSIAPLSIVDDLLAVLAPVKRVKLRRSNKLPSPRDQIFTSLQWSDPFTHNNPETQTLYWHSCDNAGVSYADEPMRALAKEKIHFRFSDVTQAHRWGKSYAEALRIFLNQNPVVFNLHAAGVAGASDSINTRYVVANKGGSRMKLKFNGF